MIVAMVAVLVASTISTAPAAAAPAPPDSCVVGVGGGGLLLGGMGLLGRLSMWFFGRWMGRVIIGVVVLSGRRSPIPIVME